MKRVNFVTLGVKDLNASKAFFQQLFGWEPVNKEEGVVFYDMGGWVFGLFPWESLAEDATVAPEGQGFRGVTIAHNVREKQEVAEVLALAQTCGATLVKPAQDVFWGGHSGYFRDLDGHLWEVAWNPFMPTKADGSLEIAKG